MFIVCKLFYTVVYDVQVYLRNESGLSHYLLRIVLTLVS